MKDATLLSRRRFLETLPCLALYAGLVPGCSRLEAAEKEVAQSIKTACRICGVKCGLDVSVKDGKITKAKGDVNSPVNKGFLCAMGLAAKEIVYSPERLEHPLKREGTEWKKISWEEALTTIAEKLQADKKTHGAQSLVVHTGKALVGSTVGADYTKFCAA
ncbi:MAG: molybdopterin-dependent oxidoreductase, partial [Proteobacteria bacterium]|nr:molybdopterin-dependent oxidoreductase [Pseudomonadota bacterium]